MVAATSVEVLMGICRFGTKIHDQFVTVTYYSSVEEHYRLPGPLGGELECSMVRVYFINEFS